MTAVGHEQRFPPLRLDVRCRLGQVTFIGTDGNGARRADCRPCPGQPCNFRVRPKRSFTLREDFGLSWPDADWTLSPVPSS